MIRKIPYLFFLIIFSFLPIHTSWAKKDLYKQQAKEFIQKLGDNAIIITSNKEKTLDELRIEMVKFLRPVIDFDFISKFVVKNKYHSMSAKQRKLFKKSYHRFASNAYAQKFKGYNGEIFNITDAKGKFPYYEIATAVDTKKIKNINIALRVRYNKKAKSFKLFDIIFEGISLLQTQRKTFESRINEVGIEEFITELDRKSDKIEKVNIEIIELDKQYPQKLQLKSHKNTIPKRFKN